MDPDWKREVQIRKELWEKILHKDLRVDNIRQLLLNVRSAEVIVREKGNDMLEQLRQRDFQKYVHALAIIVADETEVVGSRTLACSLVENSLDSEEEWFRMSEYSQGQVKHLLIRTFSSRVRRASRAAVLAIAKLAIIELPREKWPDFLQQLMASNELDNSIKLMQRTLETLEYVVTKIGLDDLPLEGRKTILLKFLVPNLNGERKLSRAAARVLIRAIDFCKEFFIEPGEDRNGVMSSLFLYAREVRDVKTRSYIFKALAHIASTYFEAFEAQTQHARRRLLFYTLYAEHDFLEHQGVVDNIRQLLLNVRSTEVIVREKGNDMLEQLRDFQKYVLALAIIVADETEVVGSRTLAGSLIENSLDSKREWFRMSAYSMGQVKSLLILTFSSPVRRASRAAVLAIAKLAIIELPRKKWPDFLPQLMSFNELDNNTKLMQRTLETLEYVITKIGLDDLPPEGMKTILLKFLVPNLNGEQKLSRAAARVLIRAIDFCKEFFIEPGEDRDGVMSSLLLYAREVLDVKTRSYILGALTHIASKYFEAFEAQTQHARLMLLLDTLYAEHDFLVHQGVMIFWCIIYVIIQICS